MDLQILYRGMDVSHLSIDEVEHELLIRNILFDFDEHESKKRRKLKDQMRNERECEIFPVTQTWRTVKEEMRIIGSKLTIIEGLLENPKYEARKREKLKTRLVHYRVRTFLLAKASGAKKFMAQIASMASQANLMFQKYFGGRGEEEKGEEKLVAPKATQLEAEISEALVEVRSEIHLLNETVTGNDLEEERMLDEASGGILEKSIEKKKTEMERSMKRSDEIMEALTEYDEGKRGNTTELIEMFKKFVIQTSEQQKKIRQKEIEEDEKRAKVAEENIKRKKRLELLLISLNEKLKLEPGQSKSKAVDPEKVPKKEEQKKEKEREITTESSCESCTDLSTVKSEPDDEWNKKKHEWKSYRDKQNVVSKHRKNKEKNMKKEKKKKLKYANMNI